MTNVLIPESKIAKSALAKRAGRRAPKKPLSLLWAAFDRCAVAGVPGLDPALDIDDVVEAMAEEVLRCARAPRALRARDGNAAPTRDIGEPA